MSYTLILGGGADQVPIIQEAQAFGLKAIVVDIDDGCPGNELSDIFIHESNRDVDAILSTAKKLGIQDEITSVLVMGSDIPHIACELCDKLKLNYWMSSDAASVATNKLKMKEFLNANSILTAPYHVLTSETMLVEILRSSRSKKIIKPQEAAGSRGVFIIDNDALTDEDVIAVYHNCVEFCGSKPPILEDYIDGEQLSVEALIIESEPQIYGYALRNYEMNKIFAPQIIENGGIQPYPGAFDKIKDVLAIIKNICSGLRLENGIIKLDLAIDCDTQKVFVIEFALRLSGGNFSSDIIPRSLDVNFLKHYLMLLYNQKVPKFDFQKYKKIYANRYLFREGHVGSDVFISHSDVEDTGVLKKPGSHVDKIRTHGDRAAWFIVSGDDVSSLKYKIDSVYKKYDRYKQC